MSHTRGVNWADNLSHSLMKTIKSHSIAYTDFINNNKVYIFQSQTYSSNENLDVCCQRFQRLMWNISFDPFNIGLHSLLCYHPIKMKTFHIKPSLAECLELNYSSGLFFSRMFFGKIKLPCLSTF